MNEMLIAKLNLLADKVFSEGNTPLSVHGINVEDFLSVEASNPQVAKHYPWPSQDRKCVGA